MDQADQISEKPECTTLGLKDGETTRRCEREVSFGNGVEHPDVIFKEVPHIAGNARDKEEWLRCLCIWDFDDFAA
jgi:hypothetical protein